MEKSITCPICKGNSLMEWCNFPNKRVEKDTCPFCNGKGTIDKIHIIKSETTEEYVKSTTKLINKEK